MTGTRGCEYSLYVTDGRSRIATMPHWKGAAMPDAATVKVGTENGRLPWVVKRERVRPDGLVEVSWSSGEGWHAAPIKAMKGERDKGPWMLMAIIAVGVLIACLGMCARM